MHIVQVRTRFLLHKNVNRRDAPLHVSEAFDVSLFVRLNLWALRASELESAKCGSLSDADLFQRHKLARLATSVRVLVHAPMRKRAVLFPMAADFKDLNLGLAWSIARRP